MSESTAVNVATSNSPFSFGKIFLVFILMLLLGASGALGVGYYQLMQSNKDLVQSLNAMQQASASHAASLTAMQKTLEENKNNVEAVNWPVAEAAYLIKLANHYLQLTHNADRAYLLLQSAASVMQEVKAPNAEPLRQALAQSLASLQAATPDKTENLYLQLAAVDNQLDNLPLRPLPLETSQPAANAVVDNNLPWWKVQWHKTLDTLSKIVVVRNTNSNDMPVALPEEKMFLYQNLHAQMEAAMLGLLQQNKDVYQVSLTRLASWVKKYFVSDAPATANVLQQLSQLQSVNLQTPTVDLTATIQLYSQYLAQNK